MKRTIKYVIAILLLAVLLADNVLPIVTKLAGNYPAAMQECDTEQNSKESEPAPVKALKEYCQAYHVIHFATPFFLLNTTAHTHHAVSFEQTYYLSVPTPPPNVA